jgi:hypothetical protein
LERTDAHVTSKVTQQSNVETHKAEGILEGKSLRIGVLGFGGRHGIAVGIVTPPRWAEYSCSVGIFVCVVMMVKNK